MGVACTVTYDERKNCIPSVRPVSQLIVVGEDWAVLAPTGPQSPMFSMLLLSNTPQGNDCVMMMPPLKNQWEPVGTMRCVDTALEGDPGGPG